MAGGVYVQGSAQYKELAKALKGAANKDLRRELSKGLSKATRPLVKDWKKEAATTLPAGGGFNKYVARSSFRTKKYASRNPGVAITCRRSKPDGGGFIDIVAVNRGALRHPLWGNRHHWYLQHIEPGWWDRPAERGKRQAQIECGLAMDRVARKIAASVL